MTIKIILLIIISSCVYCDEILNNDDNWILKLNSRRVKHLNEEQINNLAQREANKFQLNVIKRIGSLKEYFMVNHSNDTKINPNQIRSSSLIELFVRANFTVHDQTYFCI